MGRARLAFIVRADLSLLRRPMASLEECVLRAASVRPKVQDQMAVQRALTPTSTCRAVVYLVLRGTIARQTLLHFQTICAHLGPIVPWELPAELHTYALLGRFSTPLEVLALRTVFLALPDIIVEAKDSRRQVDSVLEAGIARVAPLPHDLLSV